MPERFGLHDGVLVSVRMDWAPATVALRLRPYPGPSADVVLVGQGVQRLVVPRLDAWGPSVSINSAAFRVHDELARAEIEMQSGDTVVLEADRTAIIRFDLAGHDRVSGERVEERVLAGEIDVLLRLAGEETLAGLLAVDDRSLSGEQVEVARSLGQDLDPNLDWKLSARHVESLFELRRDDGRLSDDRAAAEQIASTPADTGPAVFGQDASRFVAEQLRDASERFDGPLAQRLAGLELGLPLGFVAAAARPSPERFDHGGVDDGGADRRLAEALSGWMNEQDDLCRVVVLEEAFPRSRKREERDRERRLGDTVYCTTNAGDDADAVLRVLNWSRERPGIGVLARVPEPVLAKQDLTPEDLDALIGGAVAVLVRAWGGEAVLVAPVAGRLEPADLRPGASRR